MVKRLVERIRQKDQRAMSELYRQYVEVLSSVCYRYVPSESDVKDVLQNGFVKIFTSIPAFEYRDKASFEAWMVRIVVNEALQFLRSKKRMALVDLKEAPLQQMAVEEEPEPERLSADELHQLISELPDGYRTVLNLYVFEGYSHRMIAELLGIKEVTSATQLYYAKRMLTRKIKELRRKRDE